MHLGRSTHTTWLRLSCISLRRTLRFTRTLTARSGRRYSENIMAVLVRTCCCCCDLRRGVQLIGFFCLLSSGFEIYFNLHSYKNLTDTSSTSTLEELPVDYKYIKAITKILLAGVIFGGISMLANVLLLWSYESKNPFLAYPYFFWNIFMLLYTFGVTIFLIAIWNGLAYIFAVAIFSWLLSIYFIIVVYSYIESHRHDPSSLDMGPGVVMQMQPRPYGRLPGSSV